MTNLLKAQVGSGLASLTHPIEIIKRLESHYHSYQTYQANFKEITDKQLKQGTITVQKPDLLYVEYESPNGGVTMKIYASASKLTLYRPLARLAYEQDLRSVPKSLRHLSFKPNWTGIERFTKRYHFNFVHSRLPVPILNEDEETLFAHQYLEGAYHLKLTPKDVSLGLRSMQIWVNGQGMLLRSRVETFHKKTNDRVVYNIRLNEVIPAGTFDFEAPANVQVYKNILLRREGIPAASSPAETTSP